jgi:hypothetical protein
MEEEYVMLCYKRSLMLGIYKHEPSGAFKDIGDKHLKKKKRKKRKILETNNLIKHRPMHSRIFLPVL